MQDFNNRGISLIRYEPKKFICGTFHTNNLYVFAHKLNIIFDELNYGIAITHFCASSVGRPAHGSNVSERKPVPHNSQPLSGASRAPQGEHAWLPSLLGSTRITWGETEIGSPGLVRVPVPLLCLNAEAVVTDVSDRCLSLLGYQRSNFVGRYLFEFQEDASAQRIVADWNVLLNGNEINEIEYYFKRGGGGVIAVAMSAAVQYIGRNGDVYIFASLTDISSQKQDVAALEGSQEKLRHSQKMEAIGHLTGGIAHDFNNFLQAVRGNLELICCQMSEQPSEILRLAHNALAVTQKAAALTSQLLAFARHHQPVMESVEPVKVIQEIKGLLARAAGDRITLCLTEPTENVGACLADLNQLECALLNLVINARDAIGSAAGTIGISVRRQHADVESLDCPADGSYLRIAVRDDGPGMSEKICRRALEPFFTTKAVGEGSGLGLAQIQSFAQQAGGKVLIESTVGQGTEVAILLPSTSQPIRSVLEPPKHPAGTELGEGETILIVDDDIMVRATLAETLTDLGYEAIEACDADAALAMLQSGVDTDLVFTDLSMPGSMNGFEFALISRKLFIDIPVILTTGHIGLVCDSVLPPGVAFVRKPFSRAEIASALRHALDMKF